MAFSTTVACLELLLNITHFAQIQVLSWARHGLVTSLTTMLCCWLTHISIKCNFTSAIFHTCWTNAIWHHIPHLVVYLGPSYGVQSGSNESQSLTVMHSLTSSMHCCPLFLIRRRHLKLLAKRAASPSVCSSTSRY